MSELFNYVQVDQNGNHPSVGAVGAQDVGAGASPNATFGDAVNSLGDAAYFDAFQKSGNLNNLKGSQGTVIVFPEDLHTTPNKGHIMHFDIFYKKNPKMKDVTTKITGLFDTISGSIKGVEGAGNGAIDNFESNGSASDTLDQVLGALPDGTMVSNEGTPTDDVLGQDDIVTKDTRLGKATEESLDKVTLFMPKGLQNVDTLNYTEVDYGLIKGILEGNLQALIPGIANKAAGFVDGLGEIAGTDVNAASAISSLTGAVRNPRKEQLFESVGFRTFEFAFNFFPKSRKESHDVHEMIKLFRFHAYPEIVPNKAFYTFPSEFQITFQDISYPTNNPLQNSGVGGETTRENQWINKIGRCALTSVTVQYFPMDSMSTFADGAPTMVNMSLSFTEMETISRNHIKAGY